MSFIYFPIVDSWLIAEYIAFKIKLRNLGLKLDTYQVPVAKMYSYMYLVRLIPASLMLRATCLFLVWKYQDQLRLCANLTNLTILTIPHVLMLDSVIRLGAVVPILCMKLLKH
jgi:hypothetical protein